MVLIFASLFFAGLIFRATFISRFFLVILEKLVCSSAKSLQCISRASKDCQSQVGRVRGISTEYRMVNGKVSTTYRCYACNLYIDGLLSSILDLLSIRRSSIDRERPIINMAKYRPSIGRLSVTGEVSTDISVKKCLPIYRSTLDRHIDRHIDRYVGRVSADISFEYRPRETYSKHDPVNTYPANRDFSCPHVFRGDMKDLLLAG